MDVTLVEMVQLLGTKELELYMARKRIAELEAKLAELSPKPNEAV